MIKQGTSFNMEVQGLDNLSLCWARARDLTQPGNGGNNGGNDNPSAPTPTTDNNWVHFSTEIICLTNDTYPYIYIYICVWVCAWAHKCISGYVWELSRNARQDH